MEIWIPVQDETLILKREPTNITDRNAVAVYQDDQHVPFNLVTSIWNFDINKAFAIKICTRLVMWAWAWTILKKWFPSVHYLEVNLY